MEEQSITTIQVTTEIRDKLGALKYKLGAKDYDELFRKLIDIVMKGDKLK